MEILYYCTEPSKYKSNACIKTCVNTRLNFEIRHSVVYDLMCKLPFNVRTITGYCLLVFLKDIRINRHNSIASSVVSYRKLLTRNRPVFRSTMHVWQSVATSLLRGISVHKFHSISVRIVTARICKLCFRFGVLIRFKLFTPDRLQYIPVLLKIAPPQGANMELSTRYQLDTRIYRIIACSLNWYNIIMTFISYSFPQPQLQNPWSFNVEFSDVLPLYCIRETPRLMATKVYTFQAVPRVVLALYPEIDPEPVVKCPSGPRFGRHRIW